MRNPSVDNAKFILIFLVIFGHMIESQISSSNFLMNIYKTIYSFHMPAFIMLAGVFFSKQNNLKKTYNNIIVPFFLYNIIYELIFIYAGKSISYYTSILSPVWVMWFLYSLAIWRLITPIFLRLKYPFIISILLSAIASLFSFIGYPLGLSRTLSFYPIFLFAVVHRQVIFNSFESKFRIIKLLLFFSLAALVFTSSIDYRVWFGSTSMLSLGYGALDGFFIKILTLTTSIVMALLFFGLVMRKRSMVTKMGENTLHIYLVHGIIIKLMLYFGMLDLLFKSINLTSFIIIIALISMFLSALLSFNSIKKLNESIFKLIQFR